MLKKIKNGIKIFLGLLITFILSLFFKEKRITDKNRNNVFNTNEETKNNKLNKNGITVDNRDESSKSLDISLNNNERKYSKSSIKKDLQQLFYIIKNLEKLEEKIKNASDIEELEDIKKEIKQEESTLDSISNRYDKNLFNNEEFIEIGQLRKKCKKEIEKDLEKVDNKVYSIRQDKKNEDRNQIFEKEKINKEIPGVNFLINPTIKYKKLKLEKNTNNVTAKHIVKENKRGENKLNTVKIDSLILDTIIIKKTIDLFEDKDLGINKLKEEKKETINNNKKQEEIKIHQKDLNKYKLRIDSLKNNLNNFKIRDTSNNLSNVLGMLKNTSVLINKFNPLVILNKSRLIATSLIINNKIRQVRKINNKNVKYLKYESVVRKVKSKSDYNLQLKYIMDNTLIQIRLLKKELNNLYKLDDSLLDLIYQLNEMELELNEKIEQISILNNSKDDEKKIILR